MREEVLGASCACCRAAIWATSGALSGLARSTGATASSGAWVATVAAGAGSAGGVHGVHRHRRGGAGGEHHGETQEISPAGGAGGGMSVGQGRCRHAVITKSESAATMPVEAA